MKDVIWPQTPPLLTLLEINDRIHLNKLKNPIDMCTTATSVTVEIASTTQITRVFDILIKWMHMRPDPVDTSHIVDYVAIIMNVQDSTAGVDKLVEIVNLSRTTIKTVDIDGKASPGWLDRFEIAYKTYMEALEGWSHEKFVKTWTMGKEGKK